MKKILHILAYTSFLSILIGGVYFTNKIEFEFNFEDFFPQNDPDLDFFKEFAAEFETDDNFFLVALDNNEGIFDSIYLDKLKSITLELRTTPFVKEAISLSSLKYPIKTPFGISAIPAIHEDEPDKYASDQKRLQEDVRFAGTLFTEDMRSSLVSMKIKDAISLQESDILVETIDSIARSYNFDDYHLLGRANFQKEMIEMSTQEIIKSTIMAGILVLLIMIWIYRKPAAIFLTMGAIGLSMSGFMCYIGLSGQSFNAMAGLYPILMIIVSTSDIIHMLSKYIDELNKGKDRKAAIKVTIQDIGLATLLTSLTTSIGFATLLFSRLKPIQDFGLNAAAGVTIAFIIIIAFSAVLFPLFGKEQLKNPKLKNRIWNSILEKIYIQTKTKSKLILIITTILLILSGIGISRITTNYTLVNNLPLHQKITADYNFFEQNYAGFRPLEIAVTAKDGYLIDDYPVMQAIHKVENHVAEYDAINNVNSYTSVYKSINRMLNGNTTSAYVFPTDSASFEQAKRYASSAPKETTSILINPSKTKSRITSRVDDIGAESIQNKVTEIQEWISNNIDPGLAEFKLTGTAMLLDKNTFYVRESLLKGLGLAILIVSFIMVLLFKNIRLLVISILPNLIPLIISAAIIGFSGIELEAGLSIVFAIAFGIAVDDTIHFLSKYKLERNKGKSVEDAIYTTFKETGKAIILTSIILFFGFMVLLFSIHPPSRSIGVLIGVTLITALLSDLYLIPGLLRFFNKKSDE